MAPKPNSQLPLYEKIPRKHTAHRVLLSAVSFLSLSLLIYRLLFLSNHGFAWLHSIAFFSESYFTLLSFLYLNTKWNPVDYKMYPERLLKREMELPPVDLFVTTADSTLEPPILTINTVLSLLAVDYPENRLACYVSDDGCSLLTFYSLTEAAKFAKLWVPFCKKYNVQVRAPFRYFSGDSTFPHESSREFQQEWKRMKDEYEKLEHKIEDASENIPVPCYLTGDFSIFLNIDRKNHPTIIKVILENKEDGLDGIPHLVYISREKRPKHPHHSKAGAMNVLTRVSGVMTNAPYFLNVDCDMFVNNPSIVLQAMCVFLSPDSDKEVAFVQCPQSFYDGPQDDPYGNQHKIMFKYILHGFSGIQGPAYCGTGCILRRKVIYDLSPFDHANLSEMSEKELAQSYGCSKDFIKSTAYALKGKSDDAHNYPINLSNLVEAGNFVAGCGYENATSWGKHVGWIYGSTTEDFLLGISIHSLGWRSIYCSPDTPAFLGCAPPSGPSSMTQQKRWATGLHEALFSKHCPIFTTHIGKFQLRQRLAYLWVMVWALCSLPELSYAALSAYCIITNSHFLPDIKESAVLIPITLFVIGNIQQVLEFFGTGQSARAWWNNHRMARIDAMTSWFLGALSVVLKFLALSETMFEVTKKESISSSDGDGNDYSMTFDESPAFVLGTTILLVQLFALTLGFLRFWHGLGGGVGFGLGEAVISVWLVLCLLPFFKGLFRKGKYGIPLSTKLKSAALAFLFVHLCNKSTPLS